MSRPTKHRIAMLLALGVIAISSEIKVLPGVLSPPSRAEQAKDWVRLHAAELPGTLDEISSYPTPLRREIFAALPADAKSSLWREQLRRVRHTRNGLTARQREFLERLDNTLTPELYAHHVLSILAQNHWQVHPTSQPCDGSSRHKS